jgi:hypothetical protein
MYLADRQPLLKVRFEKVRVSQLQQQQPKLDLNSLAGTMAQLPTNLAQVTQLEQATSP